MRLINADKFKQQIVAVTIRNNLVVEKSNAICDLIDKQPTAYDVDKVIDQLDNNATWPRMDETQWITLNEAVEIVKSGGVK